MTKLFHKYGGHCNGCCECSECDLIEITNDVLNKTADYYLPVSDFELKNITVLYPVHFEKMMPIPTKINV